MQEGKVLSIKVSLAIIIRLFQACEGDELILLYNNSQAKLEEFGGLLRSSLIEGGDSSEKLEILGYFMDLIKKICIRASKGRCFSIMSKLLNSQGLIDVSFIGLELLSQIETLISDKTQENIQKLNLLKESYRIVFQMLKSLNLCYIQIETVKTLTDAIFQNLDSSLNLLGCLLEKDSDFFSSYDDPTSPIKKLALACLKLIDQFTETILKNKKLSTKMDDHLLKIYSICFGFFRITKNDIYNLQVNECDFLSDIEDFMGSCVKLTFFKFQEQGVFRSFCGRILNRIASRSDSGLSIFAYSCFMNLQDNLEIEFDTSCCKYLKVIENLHKKEIDPLKQLSVVGASLIIIGNISSIGHLREDVLKNVLKIIDFLIASGTDSQPILIAISSIFFGSYICDVADLETDESDLKLFQMLSYQLTALNNSIDQKNNCLFFFGISTLEDIFELYKNKASNQLNKFLNTSIPSLFTGILNRFDEHVLPEYFKLVEQFFKQFSKKINKNIPH